MHKQHPFLSELVLCVQKAFHDYRSTVAYSCHAILLFLFSVYYSNIPTVFSNFLSISFFLLRLLFSSCLSGCYRSINEQRTTTLFLWVLKNYPSKKLQLNSKFLSVHRNKRWRGFHFHQSETSRHGVSNQEACLIIKHGQTKWKNSHRWTHKTFIQHVAVCLSVCVFLWPFVQFINRF